MEVTRTVTETKVVLDNYKILDLEKLLEIALVNDKRINQVAILAAGFDPSVERDHKSISVAIEGSVEATQQAVGIIQESLMASADPNQGELFRDLQLPDLEKSVAAAGGRLLVGEVYRDEDGDLVRDIHASVDTAFEYEGEEMSEVLESLHASGAPIAPKKLLGDLAQTAVTANGIIQVIGLGEWNLSWKQKMVEATTTDDAAYESSVASTKSWSVTSKYMFLSEESTQSTYILSVISALQQPQTWTFFPTVEQGREAFQGQAFIESIGLQTGVGKMLGLDISLKGTGPLSILTQAAPIANPNTITGQSAQVVTS